MPLTDPPFDTRGSEDDFGENDNGTRQTKQQMLEKAEKLHEAMVFQSLKPKTGGENDYKELETFDKPIHCHYIEMISDEVSALCPVTGQPDWYTVTIDYQPAKKCIESKSLKLFLQSFRNKGLFCEKFADEILNEVVKATEPVACRVIVVQKPRGGVSIKSNSAYVRK